MKILLIDNYDSFTYMLADYFIRQNNIVEIYKNDELKVEDFSAIHCDAVVLSPGPETPEKSGILMDVVKYFHNKKPMLGVCLGHQAIGIFFGAELKKSAHPWHGIQSEIFHNSHYMFSEIPSPFSAGRYHSLCIVNHQNSDLEITATSADGEVMAMAHKHFPIWGVQFHPESCMTETGEKMIKNFLEMAKQFQPQIH